MSPDFEFAVIGAGVTGSAAAYHLAKEQKSVALFEQFAIGHERGSSHGNSRIFRLSYDHPAYVQMALRSQAMWRQLEQEAETTLLTQTGGLDLGFQTNPTFNSCITNMTKNGIAFERLSAKEVRERFGQFAVPDDMVGIYQAEAGILNATECVKSMAALAAKHGACVKENCPVLVIEPAQGGVRIVTESGTYTCKKVIVSAGAWSQALLEPLGVNLPLKVTKEQYTFFATDNPKKFSYEQNPIFTEYGATGRTEQIDMYGFPLFEMQGVKVASHLMGPKTTANMRTFDLEEDMLQEVKDYVRKRLPDLLERIVDAKTCLYSITPDEDFVIDKIKRHPQVIVLSACSGHGFKFAVLTGKMAADLAAKERTDQANDLFLLSRFVGLPV